MIGITIKTKGSLGDIKNALPEELKQGSLRAAQHVSAVLQREIRSQFKPGTAKLARSFKPSLLTELSGKRFGAGSFSDLVYAGIQDEGGVIRAKGKKLAIPLPFAKVPRGKGPRDYSTLKLIPRRGKNSLLARVTGKGKKRKIKPLFVLVDQVKIHGTYYIDRSAEEATEGVERIMIRSVNAAVRGVKERGQGGNP